MQITAIGTVAATVTLLGAFLFIRAELADLGNGMLEQIEISAYLKPNITAKGLATLRADLKANPRIISAEYVPKAEGLKELRERLRGQIDTSLLTSNPLPDKFRIRVRSPQLVPIVANDLRRLNGIVHVVYGQELVARLLQLGEVLRRIGLGLIAVFLLVGAIIIANTTRLAVYARRREITIMQLVGATDLYVRLPFIVEGLVVGLTGAIAAVLILWAVHAAVWPKIVGALPFVQFHAAAVDAPAMVVQMLMIGSCIGALAAWVSVGRHLQT